MNNKIVIYPKSIFSYFIDRETIILSQYSINLTENYYLFKLKSKTN